MSNEFSKALDAAWAREYMESNPVNTSVASATTRDVNESGDSADADDVDDVDSTEIIPFHSSHTVFGGFCGNLDVGTLLQVDNFFEEKEEDDHYIPSSMLNALQKTPPPSTDKSLTDLLADAVERSLLSLPPDDQHVVDIEVDDDEDDKDDENSGGGSDDYDKSDYEGHNEGHDAFNLHNLPQRARDVLLAMKNGLHKGAERSDETDDEDGDDEDGDADECFVVRDF